MLLRKADWSGKRAACAGTAIANTIPNQAERAEINQKTSDLPTFGQVGDALKKNLGQNDPKDIGKAIDRNTPGTSTQTPWFR